MANSVLSIPNQKNWVPPQNIILGAKTTILAIFGEFGAIPGSHFIVGTPPHKMEKKIANSTLYYNRPYLDNHLEFLKNKKSVRNRLVELRRMS